MSLTVKIRIGFQPQDTTGLSSADKNFSRTYKGYDDIRVIHSLWGFQTNTFLVLAFAWPVQCDIWLSPPSIIGSEPKNRRTESLLASRYWSCVLPGLCEAGWRWAGGSVGWWRMSDPTLASPDYNSCVDMHIHAGDSTR
ncbi:hypothetical protein RRG08_022073 [Elysia crispata]|uniref:Uncharacterized protein n=1 Tax=Elysia crispata TaxID=231223 RepID=A0AAE1CQY4_9GAST|nr:hypothetical protein RRG08_022073 [Elysia crispata]